MKKIFLFSVMTFLVTFAYSQAGISAGLKGGLNFSTITGEDILVQYENRTGYNVGAFANIRLQRLGIQPEIMFSSQGAEFNFGNASEEFNYLYVPVILKFYLFDYFNLQVGPQYGWMTKAVIKDANGQIDVEANYDQADLDLTLGVGLELPFGLNLEGRYNIGLTDIENTIDPAIKNNQVYQVSVGFRFLEAKKD